MKVPIRWFLKLTHRKPRDKERQKLNPFLRPSYPPVFPSGKCSIPHPSFFLSQGRFFSELEFPDIWGSNVGDKRIEKDKSSFTELKIDERPLRKHANKYMKKTWPPEIDRVELVSF